MNGKIYKCRVIFIRGLVQASCTVSTSGELTRTADSGSSNTSVSEAVKLVLGTFCARVEWKLIWNFHQCTSLLEKEKISDLFFPAPYGSMLI